MSRKRCQLLQSSRSPPNILKRKTEDSESAIDLDPKTLIPDSSPHKELSEIVRDSKRACIKSQYQAGSKSSDKLMSCVRSDQLTCRPSTALQPRIPLPTLTWGDHESVWQIMIEKEAKYTRGRPIVENHPELHARMRAILLDWLIEVCEVYRLQRDSYYLALDFTDRFLAAQYDLPKQQLQLIGITALFISTKLEEIYPPKLKDFAYVTDGACTETEILDLEFIMLRILNWDLSPLTANHWLTVYVQLLSRTADESGDGDTAVAIPSIPGQAFLEVAQLMDLCMLDEGCHMFPYRVIAAGAVHYMLSPQHCLYVSGLCEEELAECLDWLVPFYQAVSNSTVPAELFKNAVNQVKADEVHTLQSHFITLELLDKAQEYQQELLESGESSDSDKNLVSALALTPPISTEKCRRGTESSNTC